MVNNILLIIPLILSVLVAVFLFFLLINTKIKQVISVPFSQFLSLIILLVGLIYSFINPNPIVFVLIIFFENLLLIPHYLGMRNKEKQKPVFVPEEILPTETEEVPVEENTKSISEDDLPLLNTSKEFVIQASEAFSDSSGFTRLLDFINSSLIKETQADGGAILLVDDFDDVLAVKSFSGDFPPPFELPSDVPHKVIRVETNFRFAQFPLDGNIFGEILKNGKSELITNPTEDERVFQNEPEEFLKCGSYILIPMKIHDTIIGVAALARRFENPVFSEDNYKAAELLTDFACAAIKSVYSFQEIIEHSELTREAEIAGKLQLTLHPKLLPVVPTLSLGCFYNTAEGVCGDYYDVLPSRKDRISFVLTDVAGKGMNSLIIMVMIRAILRLTVNTTQSAATILSWANRGIAIENNIDHFASLALVNYDSTNKKVQFATAGTTPVLYYNSTTSEFTCISSSTEPIGVEKTSIYSDKEIDVHSGDILVMYSDGLVEAVNKAGLQYSTSNLIKVITENKDLSGKEIAGLVKADVKNFIGSVRQHDDQTLLVIKIQ